MQNLLKHKQPERSNLLWDLLKQVQVLSAERSQINGKNFSIAGLKYNQLPPILQEKFTMYTFDVVYLRDYSEEELEEQFFRLNNGSIFTKQQKAVVQLGTELASKINEIEQHPFWERVNVSKS